MTRHDAPTSQPLTLVIAASGKTGRRVAERLDARGVPVRRASRSGSPAFDWNDRSTWPAALAGVDAAYIVYTPDLAVPGAPDDIRAFTELARENGVKRLVLLSGRGEEEARRCERIVQDSGLEWTVVRASWFHQNFSEGPFHDLVMSGTVALPASDVLEPFVDVDDIADMVVAALTGEGHAGQLYEVTGPRLMTFAEVTAEIARAAGRELRYVTISTEEFVAGLQQAGLPDGYIELLRYLFEVVLDGRNASVTDGVERALGRAPRDFADYARDVAATGAWDMSPTGEEREVREEALTPSSNERVIRTFIEKVLNEGSFETLHDLVHPDYVYRGPGEELRGAHELEALLRGYRDAFPDLRVEIDDLVVQADKISIAFTLTGTHRGALRGIPATGRPVKVNGTILSRFEDGRIVEEWELLDQFALFNQLGLVSLPA